MTRLADADDDLRLGQFFHVKLAIFGDVQACKLGFHEIHEVLCLETFPLLSLPMSTSNRLASRSPAASLFSLSLVVGSESYATTLADTAQREIATNWISA